MKKTYVHVVAEAAEASGGLLQARVVMQAPGVCSRLPFRASNDVTLSVVGTGRPFVGIVGGKLTVGLRGPSCPDAYRNSPVVGRVPDAMQAARSVKAAVREFRDVLRAEEAELRRALPDIVRVVSGIPMGGC